MTDLNKLTANELLREFEDISMTQGGGDNEYEACRAEVLRLMELGKQNDAVKAMASKLAGTIQRRIQDLFNGDLRHGKSVKEISEAVLITELGPLLEVCDAAVFVNSTGAHPSETVKQIGAELARLRGE